MRYEISPQLERVLRKLKKKDPEAYDAVTRKIIEIVESDPEHYKPLRHDLRNIKRVHVMKSFVLLFTYNRQADILVFLDYDHHDVVYKK